MKEIALTQGKVAVVDDEDFEWLSKLSWFAIYNRSTDSFYARHSEVYFESGNRKCRPVPMHRAIMGLEPGDGRVVDHINHDTLDNRKDNLRIALRKENNRNRRLSVCNTSGFRGVSWDNRTKAWKGQIGADGTLHYLGLFATPEQAAIAYDQAAMALHGEFAHLNYPK